MTIEQKAQRYNEALKKAKKLYEQGTITESLSYVFPELKESKDERIRKELIDFLEYYRLNNVLDSKTISILTDSVAWLEKQGEQKPTDKVEPKLKIEVNKWYICISQYCNCIEGRCYMASADGRIIDDFGTEYDMHSDAYKYFRLWTIADAKDGDVLFAENFDNIGGCVFLFKGLDSWKFDAEGDRFIATGYCCTSITESGNTDFGIQGPDCVEIKRVHPASKEQRDALMKAMADAGYTFDFESKELRKIEQYPTWSDEDESIALGIEQLCNCASLLNIAPDKIDKIRTWLKALKQNTWKPSDEQLIALRQVISGCSYDIEPLVEIEEQLKKLREEDV